MAQRLKVTLMKSPHGRIPKHRCVLDALGLRKMNKTILIPDNEKMWGMVKKIPHLVRVERVE